MSLILDALKKAERQHKLGEVPKISPDSEQPVSPGSYRLGWRRLLLLTLIVLVIGIYLGSSSWLSPQPQNHEPSISLSKSEPGDDVQKHLTDKIVPLSDSETVSASNTPVMAPPSESDFDLQSNMPTPLESEAESPQVVESQPPPPPSKPPRPLYEMPSGFVAHLPSMNIDIHSYDKSPAKRYVLINMEKYREGDYLPDGPRVIEILPDGAVMEHMGEQFILPIGNQ